MNTEIETYNSLTIVEREDGRLDAITSLGNPLFVGFATIGAIKDAINGAAYLASNPDDDARYEDEE